MAWPARLTFGLLALALCAFPRAVTAQTQAPKPVYLVVPVTRDDEHLEALSATVAKLDQALAERHLKHLAVTAAPQAFEERHSRAPARVTPDEILALRDEAKGIVAAAAQRRPQEALEHGRVMFEKFEDRLETIHRDPAAAHDVFRACAAMVRAHLASQNAELARSTARQCMSAVPNMRPDPAESPPPVVALFKAVEDDARSLRGLAVVESAPADGRCNLFVQGRAHGPLPAHIRGPLGARAKLQIDCDRLGVGRVHTIVFREQPQNLFIDATFEHAVSTSNAVLRLRYEHVVDETVRTNALKLAEDLSKPASVITDVIAVSRPIAGQLVLRRINQRRGPSATLSEAPSSAEMDRALDELLRDDSHESATPDGDEAPAPEASSNALHAPRRRARTQRTPRWLVPTGAVLVGGAAITTSLAAWRFNAYRTAGAAFRAQPAVSYEDYQDDSDAWRTHRLAPYFLTGAADALLIAGGAMLMERVPRAHLRWLAPTMTAVGIGLLVTGAVQIANGSKCDTVQRDELSACVHGQEQRDRGGLLALSAAPWLVLPAITLVRTRLRNAPVNIAVSLHPSRAAATLSFRF